MKNKIIITILAVLTIITVNAQVQVDNAVLHNNGATIFITGNTVNNGGTINNLGNIYANGNLTNNPASLISNQLPTDTIFVSGNLSLVDGVYDGSTKGGNSYKGTLVMNGTSIQAMNTKSTNSDDIYNLVVDNTGGVASVVNLNGTAIVENDIKFENGIVVTNLPDTLLLASDGTVSGTPRALSHVNGFFYRVGNSLVSDLGYPIGDGLQFRPCWLKNLPVGVPLPTIGFEVVSGATSGTAGFGVDNIIDTRHWHSEIISGDYQGAQLELSYGAIEGVSDQAELIVAQSDASNGTYQSLDQSGTTGIPGGGTVISQFNSEDSYFVIAESANLRVDLTAFLEGPYVGASTMHDSLRTNSNTNFLERRYGHNSDSINPYGIEMLNGYIPPVGAVDVVMLTLRDPGTLNVDIDTTYAWLMSDGSIRDFLGGEESYATFKDLSLTSGNDYTLVVWHRNHIPLMYLAAGEVVDTDRITPAYFNLSDPTNVYGIGYKDFSGVSALYAGNADQDQVWYSIYEVDAMDYDNVRLDANGPMSTYYIEKDVNMDAKTNNTDWNITRWANDQLYYSTFPF